MSGLYCVLLLVGCTRIATAGEEVFSFDKWLDKYGYASESVDYGTWKANMEYVVAHNQEHFSFKVALNKFAHLTPEDLIKSHKAEKQHDAEDSPAFFSDPLPDAVDWRSKGFVTPVRDQGQLGSAHAFAAADAVSSFVAIHTGKLTVGSADEIVDCCHYHPCTGRLPERSAFKCVHDMGGLCSADSYKSTVKCACDNSTCTAFGTVQGGKSVQMNNESALAYAVAMEPVQVAVKADLPSFQLYKNGVYDDSNCTDIGIDHSMLLIGYGTTDKGVAYWILKNSWGVNWGMDGYMLMVRNKNMCGIASDASYPY